MWKFYDKENHTHRVPQLRKYNLDSYKGFGFIRKEEEATFREPVSLLIAK
jgi:hypothetical protein